MMIMCLEVHSQQVDTLSIVKIVGEKVQPSEGYKKTIIEKDQITRHSTENLASLLAKETNLYIKSYGPGGLSTLSIRGGGADRTKLYWNGVDITLPTLGQLDLSTIPVLFIDEVEVHQGGGSVIDGSGGLGGAIEINDKAAFNQTISTGFLKEFGSFGVDKTQGTFEYSTDKWSVKSGAFRNLSENNFSYKDISQPGFPEKEQQHAALQQWGVQQEMYFQPNKSQQLSLRGTYFNSHRDLPAIIGAINNTAYQNDKVIRVMGGWNHLGEHALHQVKLAYLNDELQYIDEVPDISSTFNIDSYQLIYELKYQFHDSLQIKARISEAREVVVSSGFSETKIRGKEALFLQLEHKTKFGLTYNLGCRQESIDYKIIPPMPSIGFSYRMLKKNLVSIYGNVSRLYKYPTMNELYWMPGGNPNLNPESGVMEELGMKLKKGEVVLDITGFNSDISNWIQWLPTSSGYWEPRNVKQVRNAGVEIELSKKWKTKTSELIIASSYQFLNSNVLKSNYVEDQSIGKQVIYVPKHTYHVSASCKVQRFVITYNQTLTGRVFVDAANTTYMPYYAPADLLIGYQLQDDYGKEIGNINLNCYNLFNEDYQIMANRPMPGRWFSISLRIKLQKKNV